ncbi:family 20 glycosylhydrolase [Niabella hibiscisoli]|uniref:family 20 glycosylhydrolase n=1 Tax=Niabella hibiscisoli TaxID=1825928 RepID=UPI0021D440EB|nr:family 20 glycosylhydrolase [Niabella hibiscisoli]
MTHILKEVNALFPSKMIHLGGDEVSFGNDKWMADKEVQTLIQQQGIKDVLGVERYFMRRIADSVFKMDAKVLAWDEVVDMGLPQDQTIVFWWRHDKPGQLSRSLNKGYPTVICPRVPFYFDFVQDSTHTMGRKWDGVYNPLKDVYGFDINKWPGITSKNKKMVLGIQANVWTETMTNNYRLDYMIYPRIAALAETAWSSEEQKL